MQAMLEDLRQARRVVRWMAQGVMPEAGLIKAVQEVLDEVIRSGLLVDLGPGTRTLAAARMGVVPTQQACLELDRHIERIMDQIVAMLERQAEQPRDRGPRSP